MIADAKASATPHDHGFQAIYQSHTWFAAADTKKTCMIPSDSSCTDMGFSDYLLQEGFQAL